MNFVCKCTFFQLSISISWLRLRRLPFGSYAAKFTKTDVFATRDFTNCYSSEEGEYIVSAIVDISLTNPRAVSTLIPVRSVQECLEYKETIIVLKVGKLSTILKNNEHRTSHVSEYVTWI